MPKEAVEIKVAGEISVKIRLIDCVGYMVDGAVGHLEGETERMVRTPWFSGEIPFTKAAELGTHKVIHDHSTIGIVVTCDGSFGEIPVENYEKPEERTVEELKHLGKPFVILLNTTRPYSEQVRNRAEDMYHKYQIPVIPVNCEQLKKEDVNMILEQGAAGISVGGGGVSHAPLGGDAASVSPGEAAGGGSCQIHDGTIPGTQGCRNRSCLC